MSRNICITIAFLATLVLCNSIAWFNAQRSYLEELYSLRYCPYSIEIEGVCLSTHPVNVFPKFDSNSYETMRTEEKLETTRDLVFGSLGVLLVSLVCAIAIGEWEPRKFERELYEPFLP